MGMLINECQLHNHEQFSKWYDVEQTRYKHVSDIEVENQKSEWE